MKILKLDFNKYYFEHEWLDIQSVGRVTHLRGICFEF